MGTVNFDRYLLRSARGISKTIRKPAYQVWRSSTLPDASLRKTSPTGYEVLAHLSASSFSILEMFFTGWCDCARNTNRLKGLAVSTLAWPRLGNCLRSCLPG